MFCQNPYPLEPPAICSQLHQRGHQVQGLPHAVQNQIQNLEIPCSQRKPKLNDKGRRSCSTCPPKMYTPWPDEAFCQDLNPGENTFFLGGGLLMVHMWYKMHGEALHTTVLPSFLIINPISPLVDHNVARPTNQLLSHSPSAHPSPHSPFPTNWGWQPAEGNRKH